MFTQPVETIISPTMDLHAHLRQYGQQHLLQFDSSLTADRRSQLHRQLSQIDFAQLRRLIEDREQTIDWEALAARAAAPPAVRLDRQHPKFSAAEALATGQQALRDGRLGMILVAGGQGTRLGFDQPKGMFPIGPISQRSLFQMHCDRLLAVMQRYGVSLPMLIMTSPATDAETRAYFEAHQRCGLAEDQLIIFQQGTMPAIDAQSGKVLLSAPDSVALSPDGHGGLVAALDAHGCLRVARERGIDLLYYAQVDNPLADLCDPELIGYHLLSRSQMTTQVVKKRFATEKVGNVVSVDGQVQIIEYSDLPLAAAEQRDPAGELKLWAGNIAVHVFNRDFLESVVSSAQGLPFHRAAKAVPYVQADGQLVTPEQPNAIKFERFVFDLLPLARGAFVVEGDAAQVFAPVKNADGAAVDTPSTARAALLNLHRQWLLAAGARIAPEVRVEIHPSWALDAAEVRSKLPAELEFVADTYLR